MDDRLGALEKSVTTLPGGGADSSGSVGVSTAGATPQQLAEQLKRSTSRHQAIETRMRQGEMALEQRWCADGACGTSGGYGSQGTGGVAQVAGSGAVSGAAMS